MKNVSQHEQYVCRFHIIWTFELRSLCVDVVDLDPREESGIMVHTWKSSSLEVAFAEWFLFFLSFGGSCGRIALSIKIFLFILSQFG